MHRKMQQILGLGLGSLALFGFLAASAMFFPELVRYLKIKRM